MGFGGMFVAGILVWESMTWVGFVLKRASVGAATHWGLLGCAFFVRVEGNGGYHRENAQSFKKIIGDQNEKYFLKNEI